MRVIDRIWSLLSRMQHHSAKPATQEKPTEVVLEDRDAYQKSPQSPKIRSARPREVPIRVAPTPRKAAAAIPIIPIRDSAALAQIYRYEGEILGTGFGGAVKKATHIASGQPRAIKKFKLEPGLYHLFTGNFKPEDLLHLNQTHHDKAHDCVIRAAREVFGLQCIDHPGIVKLHEIFLVGDDKTTAKKTLVLGMEFIDGRELTDEIQAGHIDEDRACGYLFSVAEAVKYLHDKNLVHRDIKTDNIMCRKGTAKLIDLGFTRLVNDDPLSTFCGTEHYAAPELWRSMRYDGKKADVWSLGVVMYATTVGYLPFEDKYEICGSKLHFSEDAKVRASLKDLITRMLDKNPKLRPSMGEVLAHPWMQEARKIRDANPYQPASVSSR